MLRLPHRPPCDHRFPPFRLLGAAAWAAAERKAADDAKVRSVRLTYLFIILIVLVVVVRLERQLGSAPFALEAAGVEESKIFQRAHPIHLVNDFAAPEAR